MNGRTSRCADGSPEGSGARRLSQQPLVVASAESSRVLPAGLALLITPVGETIIAPAPGYPTREEIAKVLADLVTLAEGSFDPAGHPYGEGAFKEHRYITAARSVLCRLTGKRQ